MDRFGGGRWRGRVFALGALAVSVAAGPLATSPVSARAGSVTKASADRAVSAGAVFVPVVPCRVVDTRVAGGRLGSNVSRAFQVAGVGAGFAAQGGKSGGCGVPVSAVAAEVSVTAVGPQGSGFFRMWPSGGAVATATFLNFTGGQGITNTGTVGLGTGPKDLTVKNFAAAADYVIDVQGYFSAPGDVPAEVDGAAFVPVAPCRVVDTREGGGVVGANVQRQFQVGGDGAGFASQGGQAGGCGVPESAVAAEVSVTAVSPQGNGFLRMWPSGGAVATATFLNFTGGQGITNTGTVGLGTGSKDLTVKNFAAAADYVVDVQGYFVAAADVPAEVDGAVFVPVDPCRVVDTRVAGGRLGSNASRGFQVAGVGAGFAAQGGETGGCGVPDGAVAAETSVTAVDPQGSGFLRMWPSGGAVATATFLNFTGGQGITNTGTVGLGTGPKDLTVKNFAAAADYVVDVQGYFIAPGTVPVVDIAAGPAGTCALLADGTVSCWGERVVGRDPGEGYPLVELVLTPESVPGVEDAIAIEMSDQFSCALIADGSVRCWGANFYGEFGNGSTSYEPTAESVAVTGITDATAIALGSATSCAVRVGGTVKCWGNNMAQLGGGPIANQYLPVDVVGITNATAVGLGSVTSCALLDDGTIRCWGDGQLGGLGNGTNVTAYEPVVVSDITDATALAMGPLYSCAVLVNGSVECWGSHEYGLGDGGSPSTSSTPVAVAGLTDATALDLNQSNSCALRSSGAVSCWGYNAKGQLGNGTKTNSSVPVAASGVTDATAVVAGGSHTCARLATGAVDCWGDNSQGSLGDGTRTSSSVPVAVTGISDAVEVVVGTYGHSCALRSTGTVECWGDNSKGQLGNGSDQRSSVPVPVIGL